MLKIDIFVVAAMLKIDIFLVTGDWNMLPYFHALLPPTLNLIFILFLHLHWIIVLLIWMFIWNLGVLHSPFHFELMWLGKDFAKLVPNRCG